MGDLSAHFSKSELQCRCGCGSLFVRPALLDALETVREFAGVPLVITSGYRCPEHNAAAGGKPDSAHLTGEAADIFIPGNKDRFRILQAVFQYGPSRVGIGRDFIHIDVSSTLPQETCWGYWE